MSGEAITFDFHNTLAACPEWFDLEVKHLPSAFLRWHSPYIDGALLEDADDRYRLLRREIMEHGEELPAEACLDRVLSGMGLTFSADELVQGTEALMRAVLPRATPVPGAIDAVRAIHARNVPLGIISSAVYHPFLEWTLDAFGILDAFDAVVTSASAGYYKSRPELYWHAADRLGANPGHIVHVGDSLRFDVEGASRAGFGTVWLSYKDERSDNGIRPDLTLDTLEAATPAILTVLRERVARDGRAGD